MAGYVYDRKIVDSAGANNMTGTATVTSGWICTDHLERATLEIQITGTPNGTLSVEGTDQTDGGLNTPSSSATPIAIASPTTPALPSVAGAGSSTLCGLSAIALSVKFIRLKYVNSSGSGQLNVFAHGAGPA